MGGRGASVAGGGYGVGIQRTLTLYFPTGKDKTVFHLSPTAAHAGEKPDRYTFTKVLALSPKQLHGFEKEPALYLVKAWKLKMGTTATRAEIRAAVRKAAVKKGFHGILFGKHYFMQSE